MELGDGAQKPRIPQAGDWCCNRCGNENYSYQVKCYICKLNRDISEKMQKIQTMNMTKGQFVQGAKYMPQPALPQYVVP